MIPAFMPHAGLAAAVRAFFSNGEQGGWYDPSDRTTLFQDSAGTTPVTAMGQPVGLILDKSKGLVLGPELVTNGTFDTNIAGWNPGFSNSGTATWDNGRLRNPQRGSAVQRGVQTVAGKSYKVSALLESNGVGNTQIYISNSTATSGNYLAVSKPVIGGPKVIDLFFTATAATTYVWLYVGGTTGNIGWFDNISVRELPGNHAFQLASTSRPVFKLDENGKHYLKFDGVDDFLITNSINFTATDKMTVWAGVRKLSDAAIGMVAELSATVYSNGSFNMQAPPNNGLARYGVALKGTTNIAFRGSSPYSFAAPRADSISIALDMAQGDVTANAIRIRANGTEMPASNDGTQPTTPSNFGNYPLYIGRRGGASLPFNGHLYQLIIRGAATSEEQIASTERYVNQKTKAY